jgi:hypothetical protein
MGDIPIPYLVAGVLVVAGLLLGFLRPKKERPDYQSVECGCGWKGQVSRYAGRCPKCNEKLGQQLASPPKHR